MKRLLLIASGVFATALAVAVGCGDSGTTSTMISQVVGPEGAVIVVPASVDPDLAGMSLYIPPQALSKPITVTLAKGDDLAVAPQTALGPAVRIGPDGVTFSSQAVPTLTLPYKSDKRPPGAALGIAVSFSGQRGIITGEEAVTADPKTGKISVDLHHFGAYQAIAGSGLRNQCAADVDCPAGKKCASGSCGTFVEDAGVTPMPDLQVGSCSFDSDCPMGQRCINGLCF